MVPIWKLKREVLRLFREPWAKSGDAATFLFGRLYYDHFLAHQRRVIEGAQSNGAQQAVYLIYPSNGLLPSHLRSLRYLQSKGVSTTVVSNLPLSLEDEERLQPLCRRYIERPNFGYDFGGYRDGVLSLRADLQKMQQLILLNDSVWFPISDRSDWLADIQQLGVNFGASASHHGLPRPNPADFRDFVFGYKTDHRNFHYASYALSFDEAILRHPAFVRFWKTFPLTNKKRRVVRRGEIGLTTWMLKQGFTHGETLDVPHLEQTLNNLPEDRLFEIAQMVIVTDDPQMQATARDVKRQLPQMKREDATKFILTAAAREGSSYALAAFSILDLGYPFLKKSPVWLDQESSDTTIAILERLDTPAAREALAEAQVLRRKLRGS